jgi:hypothetical protein
MNASGEEREAIEFPIFFHLAPEYRRCGIILVFGYALLAAACIGSQLTDFGSGWDWVLRVILLFSPMLLGALFCYRLKLRIDERGLWRRRFIIWDLWSWESFSGGLIKHGTRLNSFIFPSKFWMNRNLSLEHLSAGDRKQLLGIIKSVWVLPELTSLPDRLSIRWGIRSWARLQNDGIKIGKGKRDVGRFYPWSDLPLVRITRLEHTRRDFKELEVTFPDTVRPMLLRFHDGRPLWEGAEAEIIAAFLERVVPSCKLLITATNDLPQTQAEADWRTNGLDSFDRETRSAYWFAGAFLLLLAIMILYIVVPGLIRLNPMQMNNALWLALCFCVGGMLICFIGAVIVCWFVLSVRNKASRDMHAPLDEWHDRIPR